MTKKKPIALIILDGWGLRDNEIGNAIALAKTPNIDLWRKTKERAILDASGEAVGLTADQMGNSEVGHLNIGAGRVVYQDISRIDYALDSGEFFSNPSLVNAFNYARDQNRHVHLFGLLGQGGVHSHTRHLYAIIQLASKLGIVPIIHVITDGRDTPPNSAINFVVELEEFINKYPAIIRTVSGRYYAMDRDKRWERTKQAYVAYVDGQGLQAPAAHQAVLQSYADQVSDEFIKPTVIESNADQNLNVQSGDVLLFFNFRADRMRQIVKSFVIDDFSEFERGKVLTGLKVLTLTEYEENLPVEVIFAKDNVILPLAEIISAKGLKQFHAAETEKYAHVTFFFNGGREEPFDHEDRLLIPSPKVATYDLKPEMSACELAEAVLSRLQNNDDDFMIINFANLDMVGHTGILEAGIKAAETIDRCVGMVVDKIIELEGVALVTSDHGNAEIMYDVLRKEPHTYHSTNPVQLFILGKKYYQLRPCGILADIAPTILELLDIPKPEVMTGRSLIEASAELS